MANQVYALLFAVDKYRNPVPALNGCVRDSKDVEDYLRASVPTDKLHLMTLRDEEATKANVIDAFLTHLTQAEKGDYVFVHYAGHGSQEKSPQAFWYMEPDRMNETLVCYDSRQTIGGVYHRDLADKELSSLVYQVSKKGPEIVLMMDCCHSGSNSRETQHVTKRQSPADGETSRALNDYVFMHREEFGDEYKNLFAVEGDVLLPTGPHINFSACRSIQTAKELTIDGHTGGIFTYSMLETLRNSKGNITYNDLLSRASVIVENKVGDQNPGVDVVNPGATRSAMTRSQLITVDGNNAFLGGEAVNNAKSHLVFYNEKRKSWMIEAGLMHGIPNTQGSGSAEVAVFENDVNIEDNPTVIFKTATIKSAGATESLILFDESEGQVPRTNTYQGMLLNLPINKLRVYFEAELADNDVQQQGIKLLQGALKTSDDPKKLIEEVASINEADYRVLVYEEKGKQKYAIMRPGDNQPLVNQTVGFSERNADEVIGQLASIASWESTFSLDNPSTQIPTGTVKVDILASHRDPESGKWSEEELLKADATGGIPTPYYTYEADPNDPLDFGVSPRFRIKLRNTSNKNYYLALFYMGSDFSVTNILFDASSLVGGSEVLALSGEPTTPDIAAELLGMGIIEDTAYLKLVMSTTTFDPSKMEQEGLKYPEATRGLRIRKKPMTTEDWRTETIRLISTYHDSGNDAKILANAGVSVNAPNGVNVDIALSSTANASRSTETAHLMPAVLRGSGAQPLDFVSGRGNSPNVNVLELRNIDRPDLISADNPLEVKFNYELDKDEKLMTVVQEDGIFYPVVAEPNGDGSMSLKLDKLPDAEEKAQGERSLGRTVKLVFHKMLGGKFGIKKFDYPRISSIDDTGEDLYFEFEPTEVAAQVAKAKKVLVVVHGFTSSCYECFFESAANGGPNPFYQFLRKHYDLVLGYDYETFSTRIETNASSLKERLEAVGLKEGHGKDLHFLVHSMGGLVSRYYIEQLGGNKVVNHLIMAGTPNGGSPWPSFKKWLFFGSTLILNNIPVIGWGLSALSFMLGSVKAFDNLGGSMEQMAKDSDFLKVLQNANDPGIPYTVLAGDTSSIPKESEGTVGKILERMGINDPDFSMLKKWVFKEPNDMAVGVASIKHVPTGRSPLPAIQEVPSNHFSYFSEGSGLGAVQQVISGLKSAGGPTTTTGDSSPTGDTQTTTEEPTDEDPQPRDDSDTAGNPQITDAVVAPDVPEPSDATVNPQITDAVEEAPVVEAPQQKSIYEPTDNESLGLFGKILKAIKLLFQG